MQKIIDNMRGPLTCLVVFALMVMTPFADPQIALASDYAGDMLWESMEAPLFSENYLARLPETEEINKSVEGQLLAMSEQTEMSVKEDMAEHVVETEESINEPIHKPVEEDVTKEAGHVIGWEISSDVEDKAVMLIPEEWIAEQAVEAIAEEDTISQESSFEQKLELPNWRIKINYEQLDLLERCVMAEGGGESYKCQVAIACVIINRVLSDKYPDNVEDVIKQKGQFSTWPGMIERMVPSNEVKQAVREALATEVIPENVLYFRAGRYHKWGTRYCRINNTYFSTP